MPLSRRRITEPAALKALAHPVRLELLDLLVLDGPKTATEAAAAIGGTPANASWHLRKLAEQGFVREVTGGPGRSRPWRAVSEGLTWGGDPDDPDVSAAGAGLADLLLDRELQRFRAARAGRATEPAEWRDAQMLEQSALWLTADEAAQLGGQIRDLFLSKSERLQDSEQRPEGARLVSLVGWLVPHGPMPVAARDDELSEPSAEPSGVQRAPVSRPGPTAAPRPGPEPTRRTTPAATSTPEAAPLPDRT